MSRYAEWIEYERGGRNNRTIKRILKQSRRILDENETNLLVEDQEGPIWISKHAVNIVERRSDESTQV